MTDLLQAAFIAIMRLMIVKRKPGQIFSSENWRDYSFGRLWPLIAPIAAKRQPELAELIATAQGIVVDIGPGRCFDSWVSYHTYWHILGTGAQLYYYKEHAKNIKHIFFIEPNESMHNKLKKNAAAAQVDGKYTILACGAENMVSELTRLTVPPGCVDAIVSIMCLCSVPDVETKVARAMYEMLAPGGRLLIWEHVLNQDSSMGRAYQKCLQPVWPALLGGCHLMEKTDDHLRSAGEWSSVDLRRPKDDPRGSPVPFIYGTLIKAVDSKEAIKPEISEAWKHDIFNSEDGLLKLRTCLMRKELSQMYSFIVM
jgi:SAM-dependent methyltransferase